MKDKENNASQLVSLGNEQLWEKAGSNQPITSKDLGIKRENDDTLQNLNESLSVLHYDNKSQKLFQESVKESASESLHLYRQK